MPWPSRLKYKRQNAALVQRVAVLSQAFAAAFCISHEGGPNER
jgi:hypothetical protein